MAKILQEVRFGSLDYYVYGTDPYDSTSLGIGPLG